MLRSSSSSSPYINMSYSDYPQQQSSPIETAILIAQHQLQQHQHQHPIVYPHQHAPTTHLAPGLAHHAHHLPLPSYQPNLLSAVSNSATGMYTPAQLSPFPPSQPAAVTSAGAQHFRRASPNHRPISPLPLAPYPPSKRQKNPRACDCCRRLKIRCSVIEPLKTCVHCRTYDLGMCCCIHILFVHVGFSS